MGLFDNFKKAEVRSLEQRLAAIWFENLAITVHIHTRLKRAVPFAKNIGKRTVVVD